MVQSAAYYAMLVDQGGQMETVTVSPKYQVVIPSRVRQLLGVEPGQKVKVILYDNRIEMIPVRPIKEARGFLKGIDTSVDREPDRP
jgi:AbrB family looped-hinge helix DNA binding protein